MKNIFIAAIFFMTQTMTSQMVFARGRSPSTTYKSADFQIEKVRFSDLVLSKQEINLLSTEDKAKYFIAMQSLSVLLEMKQQNAMGYEDFAGTNKKTSSVIFEKLNNQISNLRNLNFDFYNVKAFAIYSSLVQPALAVAVLIPGAIWAGAMAVGRFVLSRAALARAASASPATRQVASEALSSLSKLKVDIKTLKYVNPTEALSASKEAIRSQLTHLKNLEKLASKAKGAEKAKIAEEIAQTHKSLGVASQAYRAAGASAKDLTKLVEGSTFSKIIVGTGKGAAAIGAGTVTFAGWDVLTKESLGVSLQELAKEGMVHVGQVLGFSGLDSVSLESLRKGDSSQSAGKSCLFGGHPSQWKEFGEIGIKCTRPESSRSEKCSGDNKFLCASHGIQVDGVSMDDELCIDKGDLNNLTVRCSKTLLDLIEKKRSSLDTDKQQAFLDGLKSQLVGIEKNAGMKEEDGKTKSILAYCVAENVTQKPECESIFEIVALLKTTKVGQVLATRKPVVDPPAATPSGDGTEDGDSTTSAPQPPPPPAGEGGTTDGPTRTTK